MSAPDPTDVIEQAVKVAIEAFVLSDAEHEWTIPDTVRALHDAGLLNDPADRDAIAKERDSYAHTVELFRRQRDAWKARAESAEKSAIKNAEKAVRAHATVEHITETRAERAEAEVARLTARLGDCHCDLNPATTDGPHEDCPQHGRSYAEWVEATDAKGAQVEALTARVERAEAEIARLREGAAGLAADWRRETENQYLIAASDLDELVNDPEPKQALAMAVAELRATVTAGQFWYSPGFVSSINGQIFTFGNATVDPKFTAQEVAELNAKAEPGDAELFVASRLVMPWKRAALDGDGEQHE